MSETALTLEIIDKGSILTQFCTRECTQTLSLLPQGVLKRTINGNLVYVGRTGHQKYESQISCKDKAVPALSGVWKGTLLNVGCLQWLTQIILPGESHISLERPAVAVRVFDHEERTYPPRRLDGKSVFLESSFPGGYIAYRPALKMIVRSYTLETNEWGLSVGWNLDLEEE